MRIFKLFTLAVILLLTLSGCNGLGGYTAPSDKRLVSAVGFDNEGGMVKVSVEAMKAEDGENTKFKPYIISESGSDATQAIARLSAQSYEDFTLTHCRTFILGKSLTAEQVEDILTFCINQKQISLSATTVCSNNANETLKVSAMAENSTGFEINNMTEHNAENFGFGGHTSLYEVQTARMQSMNIYALPNLIITDNNISLKGMTVYIDDIPSAELDDEQSVAYSVMRNVFEGGEIIYDKGVYNIKSARADVKAKLEKQKLYIDITLKAEDNQTVLADIIENTINDFDKDIFGIGDTLKLRYPEIWEMISSGYDEYYKNAEITVKVGD